VPGRAGAGRANNDQTERLRQKTPHNPLTRNRIRRAATRSATPIAKLGNTFRQIHVVTPFSSTVGAAMSAHYGCRGD